MGSVGFFIASKRAVADMSEINTDNLLKALKKCPTGVDHGTKCPLNVLRCNAAYKSADEMVLRFSATTIERIYSHHVACPLNPSNH